MYSWYKTDNRQRWAYSSYLHRLIYFLARPFALLHLLNSTGTYSTAVCKVHRTCILTRSFTAFSQELIHTRVEGGKWSAWPEDTNTVICGYGSDAPAPSVSPNQMITIVSIACLNLCQVVNHFGHWCPFYLNSTGISCLSSSKDIKVKSIGLFASSQVVVEYHWYLNSSTFKVSLKYFS